MSRRTSRRRQQAMNEWRRLGRWLRLADLGVPVKLGPGVWYIPSDPAREREEFVRQLTAKVPLQPGEPVPMRGEVGVIEGIRVMSDALYAQAQRNNPPCRD